jgi:hypothetical protein
MNVKMKEVKQRKKNQQIDKTESEVRETNVGTQRERRIDR